MLNDAIPSPQIISERLNVLRERLTNVYDVGVLIRAFLKYIPIPMIMVDRNQHVLLWTKQFAEEFDLDDSGDLSDTHLKLLLPEFYSHDKKFSDLLKNTEAGFGGVELTGGNIYEYQINPWPLNGKMGGCLLTLVNQTSKYELLKKFKDTPNHITCEDQRQCVWRSPYGQDLIALAKSLVTPGSKNVDI
jgi:hypothetical protein